MTTNRAVAIVSVLAAVVTGVLVPLLDVVENDIAQAVIIGVVIVAVAAIVITWLIGWQKHETRVAVAPPPVYPDEKHQLQQ